MIEMSESDLFECGIDIEKIRKRYGSGKTLIIRTAYSHCRDLRLSLCVNMKKVIDKFGTNKEITIEIPDHDEMARVVVTDKCRPQITNTKLDYDGVSD